MDNILNLILSLVIASTSILNFNLGDSSYIYKAIDNESYEIIEQGIQGKYLSENSMDEEIELLKSIFKIKEPFQREDKSFYFNYEKDAIELNIFGIEEKKGLNIEITIKAKDKEYDINLLEKTLKEINGNINIANYVKSKINNNLSIDENKDNLEREFKKLSVNSIESIEINSGITGIAKFKDGEKINYGIVSYGENENYLILGTPVIFITY